MRRRSARTALGPPLACLLCLLVAPPLARADLFGPISLGSVGAIGEGSVQQAEYARDATVSADGRYVAFDGSVGGVTGVWRLDRDTGRFEQVAGGAAELPSISGEGRYVSFTTNEGAQLPEETQGRRVLAPHAEAANVYVRDMYLAPLTSAAEEAELRPAEAERAFQVVSAPSGSSEPLTYLGAGTTLGSAAVGRTAISADGREVAFVTTAVSDLEGEPGSPSTPALQVAVRDLTTLQTRRVSEEYEPAERAWTGRPVEVQAAGQTFGAVYPGSPAGLGFRRPPTNGEWASDPPVGASISADGSTVAWLGEDIAQQAQMLPGERPSPIYTEPLWRRIAPGGETHTERVTGGSEPLQPACLASGEVSLPAASAQNEADPCQGPFAVTLAALNESRGIWSEAGSGSADFVPRLSADGSKVAFLASAPPTGSGAGVTGSTEGEPSDAYVADMSPALSRREALTPVTRIAGSSIAGSAPVTDVAISPDGTQVAYTTRRTQFHLGFPALISPQLPEPGEAELYDADLANGTLTQVTHGLEGQASSQPHKGKSSGGGEEAKEDPYPKEPFLGAQSPEFAAEGYLLSFDSTAGNLVYGDGNTPTPEPATQATGSPFDGSDAFVVARLPFEAEPAPNAISPAPELAIAPEWAIQASATARRDGTVAVALLLPGAGRAALVARSRVPVRVGRRTRVLARTVAGASHAFPASLEPVDLTLRLSPRYRSLASRAGGVESTVAISFAAAGHPTLRTAVRVTFAGPVAHRSRSARRRRGRR